ncbi:hypothetical protein ACFWTC_03075 [Streptomyces sp. NPDC058619]|uniref:hypothetical protein n=1 Tax=unclassified Streptomyces TaxID=2593676 RepID=UPI00364C3515
MSEQPAPGEVRQVLVPATLWAGLELFLAAYHGAELTRVGQFDGDELTTWSITPMQSRLDRAAAGEQPC